MKELIIPIHSFVDLITNSSTEIYIAAGEQTVISVRDLVNSILAIGGSKIKCDDLFTIELGETEECYDGCNRPLIVKAKENTADAEIAAKLLGSLADLFSINACYNG